MGHRYNFALRNSDSVIALRQERAAFASKRREIVARDTAANKRRAVKAAVAVVAVALVSFAATFAAVIFIHGGF